jgi:hypothetical protein
MQGTAYYDGNQVTILDLYSDKALIICSNNPIECDWVKVSELDNITWVIKSKSA